MPESISPEPPASLSVPQTPIHVVMRFRADVGALESALRMLSESAGFLRGSLARSVDDPSYAVIAMEFSDVGSYRKALSRYEIKAMVIPLLSTTLDDITTYEMVTTYSAEGVTDFVSAHAIDSHETQLGSAAQAHVEPLPGTQR